jgi:hypothetical protein
MKTVVNELDAFITKCPKTSHSADCLSILSPIKPDVGPVYTDLENFQKNVLFRLFPLLMAVVVVIKVYQFFQLVLFFLIIASVIINLYFII